MPLEYNLSEVMEENDGSVSHLTSWEECGSHDAGSEVPIVGGVDIVR